MELKIGSDIVYIPRLQKTFLKNKEYFLNNVFLRGEIKNSNLAHIAGRFASKEAVIKAIGMEPGRWLEIEVSASNAGRPFLKNFPGSEILNHKLTISHDGDYAVAFVIFFPK